METAEDIASEVFVKALSYQSTLAEMSQAQCRLWLYTSAKRKLIDLARKRKTESRVITTVDPVNQGPELIKSGFEAICKYTKMNLIDVYGVCTSQYKHIKEDMVNLQKAYEMGLRISL